MVVGKRGNQQIRRAFSLLELLAVVTILAIIASIVVPRISLHAFLAKEKACLQYRSDINSAIERYMFDHGAPPAQLSDLQSGDYYPNTIPNCPVDNLPYTIDPATSRISGHNH